MAIFETEIAKVKYKDHPLITELHDINYNHEGSWLDKMQ